MVHSPRFFCVLAAIFGFVASGIIWFGLSHPELIVDPEIERTDHVVYLIGRDPWLFPIAMALLGRFAVHVLFEVKAAPEPPSSSAGAKPRAEKEAYFSSESQSLWAFRLTHLSAIIAVMIILCFDHLSTRFPPETLEQYVWVWAIFGPALPFLTLFLLIPYVEFSRWRRQGSPLELDISDAEKACDDSSGEDEDYEDDGTTADTDKQHAANSVDKGEKERLEQNTSRICARYSNSESEWILKLLGLSMLVSILASTIFLIFFCRSSGREMEPYMWILFLFGPAFLQYWTLLFAIVCLEWSRWCRQRARPGVDRMDAENAYAAYTDDAGKVDEKEPGL